METLTSMSPELAGVLAGMAISGFTQLCKWLQDKTGLDVFRPKTLAVAICLFYALGMMFYKGGESKEMAATFTNSIMFAWATGQGIYALMKAEKKSKL